MGTFYIDCSIENPSERTIRTIVPQVLVDTGSEYTWIPSAILQQLNIPSEKKDVHFVMANGTTITRRVGFSILRIGEYFTIDEVVFGEDGDLSLLGARTLEGMNLLVDAARKQLVAAGPLPAAGGNPK